MFKKNKALIIISLSVFLLVLISALLAFFYYSSAYRYKLLPKTYLGSLDLSVLNKTELLAKLDTAEEEFRDNGLNFSYQNEIINLDLGLKYDDPDIPNKNLKYADSIIYYKSSTVEKILAQQNFFNFIKAVLNKNYRNQNYFDVSYSLETLTTWLYDNFPVAEIEAENAYYTISESGDLVSNPEKIGKEINLDLISIDIDKALTSLSSDTIYIKTKSKYPNISEVELNSHKDAFHSIISQNDFSVFFIDEEAKLNQEKIFPIPSEELITWLDLEQYNNNYRLRLNKIRLESYLNDEVADEINKEMILPRFELQGDKVSSWQVGKNGQEIDLDQTINNIQTSLDNKLDKAEIAVQILDVSDFSLENDFKIQDLIGSGVSDFAGSPVNRRHNIKVGADAIHGLLIKPGGEFSLVETLGEIDAASGYLPELVIKGDKTIPEYGGGLCQVATSIFRSALDTGLPITERRNHSYRVSYYEPAGMDASVYDPWPDVKFINDTENYILIQSRIEGDLLYFDFWGTTDGRVATTTKPVIYNIVAPPPAKLIETDELAPGVKKCTESAHYGADAYFDYTVNYPASENSTSTIKTVRFNSHYVPWQEVCLIGRSNEVDENENEEELDAPIEEEEETLE